jgi:hypothetical protein
VSYRCASCQDEGLRDCDELDLRVLQETQPRGLHYWHILDRVARDSDKGRKLAEKLLEIYTPRSLYALSNLLLKTDDLFGGRAIHDWMRLLLLGCFEQGSKLNAVPGNPPAPHAGLEPPAHFVEWNIWQVLEDQALRLGQAQAPPVTALAARVADVVHPSSAAGGEELVRAPQAYVGHMPVKQLAQELDTGNVHLILSHPLQPGRTHWALTYLWTGWLYGHTEAAALWPLVRRRASDWPWYLTAMRATLRSLQKTLAATGRVVLMGQGKGMAYHEALSLAAAGANLRMQNALYQPSESEVATRPFAGLRGDYRVTWTTGPAMPSWPMSARELVDKVRECAVAVAEETLELRGEPTPFVRLHCAIWEALARRNLLQRVTLAQETIPLPDWVRREVQAALEEQVGQTFVLLWKDEEQQECMWWLTRPPGDVQPLTERVEQAVYDVLAAAQTIGTFDLMHAVFARFPLAMTPDSEWTMSCVKSYAQPIASGDWTLRPAERAKRRSLAHKVSLQTLRDLGQRLGYHVALEAQGRQMQWSRGDQEIYTFLLLDSLALSQMLRWKVMTELKPTRFAVMPSARQSLLHGKLARFPWLRTQLDSRGWQFIHVEDLPEWISRMTQDRTQLTLI